MRRRKSSTWKRISRTRRATIGKTNTGHANLDTSTAFTLDTNGTSITRHIMSKWCLMHYLSLILINYRSTDNPPPKVVQGYKVSATAIDGVGALMLYIVQYLLS